MDEVEKIEERVRGLSKDELKAFRAWFAEFDALAWDDQIRADASVGKLDAMVAEALVDHKAGRSRPL
jgi:hypothetical protein